MRFLSKIFYLYYDGFRNMTLGKSLWLVIILKLLIIFGFLKIFIYDKSIKKYSNKQAFLKRLIMLIEFEFENTHLDL